MSLRVKRRNRKIFGIATLREGLWPTANPTVAMMVIDGALGVPP
jgi:hypothetical protein